MTVRLLWKIQSHLVCCLVCAMMPVLGAAQCAVNAGNDVTICAGQAVTLGGNPTVQNGGNGISYAWNNGAGSTANPQVTPASTTTYTLTVNSSACNGLTDQVTVTVLPAPVPSFTFPSGSLCAAIPVSFSNATSNCAGCTYSWNFGNPASGAANTSTLASPSHAFVAPGNGTSSFTVSLTATASNGCSSVYTAPLSVLQSPVAALTEDANFTQCIGIGEFYAYVNNASSGTGVGTTYAIDWGDGTPDYSSTSPPSSLEHIYTGISIWTLEYTVTNSNGCSDSEQYEVSNITNPAIGAATLGNTLQCGPVEFCFPLSNYQNNHPSTVYLVNFGDGSPVQSFNHPPPATVCYTYSTSTCANSPQFFTFSITADNNCTPSNATISPIQIYLPPDADFTAPPAACVNTAVPFTNTTIPGYNQGCNANANYLWNFGDPASGAANTSTLANPTHVYAAPGTYTVTLTASNAGNPVLSCGSTTITRTICIEQPPAPVFSVSASTGCVPMTVTTVNSTSGAFASCNTASSWNITYSDLPCDPDHGQFSYTGGTSASSAAPQVILSSAGIYTMQLLMTNTCGTFQDTEQITVNTVPEVSLTAVPPVCAGATVTPQSTVNGCNLPVTGYAWTFAGGAPASSNQASPGAVTYAGPGNYAMSLTATNACGPATATTQVSVLAPPDVTVVSNAPGNAVCAGSALTLNATGAATYTWSPSAGLSSATGSSVQASPSATTTYTVTGTSGSCTDQTTVSVTVLPFPSVAAAGSYVICQGATAALGVTVSGGQAPYGSYLWSNGATLNNANIANPVSSATASLTYSVQVTDANGCAGTGQVPLTVNPLPQVSAGPDITLCSQPVPTTLSNYSPVSGGSGTWSGPGVTAAGVFTPSGEGAFTLQYCFTGSVTGCQACDQLSVNVIAPQNADAGPDVQVCLGAPAVQLQPVTQGGSWSPAPVTPSGLFNPASAGTFSLTYTLGNGSCQTTDQMEVEVLPVPAVNAGADQTICAGGQVQLSATASSANGAVTGYAWIGGSLDNAAVSNPTAVPAATATYTVTVQDEAGCSASDQVVVSVNALPVVNAGPDQTFCDQPVPVALIPVSPASGGVWSGPGVSPSGVFTPSGTGSFVLTYAYTDPVTQCQNSDQLTVNVAGLVQANAGPDVSVCMSNGSIQLQPVTGGGTWSPAPVSSGGQFNPAVPGVYNLTYTLGTGTCQTTDQLTLTVHALPSAQAGPDAAICAGQSVQLNGSGTGGTAGYAFAWSPDASVSNPASASTSAQPSATTTFTLTVTDANGCSDTDDKLVSVNVLPVVEAGNPLTLCDQPISQTLSGFSPVAGGSGSWSGTGISDPGGVFLSPGAGSYWLTYSFTAAATGCVNADSILVTVQLPVVAEAGMPDEICLNNGLYQLAGFSPASGGSWSGPGIVNAQTGTFNPQLAGTGSHTLTLEYGSGTCYSSDQVVLEVLPLPAVTAGPALTICGNDQPVALSGMLPASGGTWSGPGVNDPSPGIFNPGTGVGSFQLIFTYEDPLSGCADSAFRTVSVSPVPVASFTMGPTGCTNGALSLTNTSSGAASYSWNFGNGQTATGAQPQYTYPSPGSYTVTLSSVSSLGCQHTAALPVEILDPPSAAPVLSVADGCAPLLVTFGNNSTGQNLVYEWTLFNGMTSSEAIPLPFTYPQGDDVVVYPVSLTVSNFCGTDTETADITVYPQPTALFGTDLDVFCSPFTVNFSNVSTGNPDTWSWNFGDGSGLSALEQPGSHVYFTDSLATDYVIVLEVENECGSDTASHVITVLPNTVESFFNTDITWGCHPLTVSFTDYSQGATQIQFDFGNGSFSGSGNVQFTFDQPGQYTVYHYADNGCSFDTSSVMIEVYPSPDLDFDMDAPYVCEGEEVGFISNSTGAVAIDWEFGDGGTSALSNPVHVYSGPGEYSVVMNGTGPEGCTSSVSQSFSVFGAPQASFTVPSSLGCSPFEVCMTNTTPDGTFFSWDFGNGNTSVQSAPCYTFENTGAEAVLRTVSLIAQNQQLCADTFSLDVIVAPQPVSAFELGSDESCYFPVSLSTQNQSQFANGFAWSVNGDPASTLNNPSFVLSEVGVYLIELTATNQFGCSDTAQRVFAVHPRPTASFAADEPDGCVPHTVGFVNTSSGGAAYEWLFGDGTSSGENNPTHTYEVPGTYSVGLIVSTAEGCVDTLVYAGYVEAYALPEAAFSYMPEETDMYAPWYVFQDQSFGAATRLWSFGDGTSAVQPVVHHYFGDPGTWEVSLQVWNALGCTSSRTEQVTIADVFHVYAPNAVTADDDGLNDVFLPVVSGLTLIEWYEFQVFDRWGTVLFRSNDPGDPWICNVRGGDYFAKDDVYNWQIRVRLKGADQARIFEGHVVVIR
jgi:large repetitive protein